MHFVENPGKTFFVKLGYIKIEMICVNSCRLLEIVADGGEGSFFIPIYFVRSDFEGNRVDFVHDERCIED